MKSINWELQTKIWKKQAKYSLKKMLPEIKRLKALGFQSSGWFWYGDEVRLWKKENEFVYMEIRGIYKCKIVLIPKKHNQK